MKTQKLKYLILAFGTVFLSSCSELLYTSLDVLRPAKVAFAANANNLLIVNNTVKQPENMGHRSELLNQKTKNVSLETDSLALFCLGSLKEELDSKAFFSSVQLLTRSLNKSDNFLITNPLNQDSVKALCRSNYADVILSLDKIKVNDDISEYFLNESNSFLAAFEVRYESYWSIHYPNNPEAKSIQFKDTIYWESQSYIRKRVMDGLPKRLDGVIDGALNVGKQSVTRLLPHWEKVDRYLFTSTNHYVKQGMDSMYVKNWKSAISLWEKAYNTSKNALTKTYAANNLAVAYEITGDINKAIEFVGAAYNSLSNSYFSDMNTFSRLLNYQDDLIQRKKEIELLKVQLGEK